MKSKAAVVIASPCSDRRRTLVTALIEGDTDPMILEACDRSGALRLLATYEVGVIISDIRLRDGGWKDFLSHTALMPQPPRLIVVADCDAASLWAEVLNLGGYDALMEPLEADEVRRVVASALDAWDRAREPVSRKVVSSAKKANQSAAARKPVPVRGSERSSVLVVDSDPYSRRIVESVLTAQGFNVLLADNGAQALALFQNHSSRICFVIIDSEASGMRYDDLLDRLSTIDPDVKVVISGGQPLTELQRCLAGHRVADFLRRPFTVSALTHVLQSVAAA